MPTVPLARIKNAMPESADNVLLANLKGNDFFEPGNGGMDQFKKDFVVREFMCKGSHLRDKYPGEDPSAITPAQITSELEAIYGKKYFPSIN